MIQFQLLATAYTFLEYLYSRITKFKNKGSDNLCQALIKLNLVFSTEFKFTSGIYLFIQPNFSYLDSGISTQEDTGVIGWCQTPVALSVKSFTFSKNLIVL